MTSDQAPSYRTSPNRRLFCWLRFRRHTEGEPFTFATRSGWVCSECGHHVTTGVSTGGPFGAPHRPQVLAEAEQLVVVEWDDTTNIAGWIGPDEVAEFATGGSWRCRNVGWLVHEDDDCVVLSARRSSDDEQHVGLTERIPKRAIVSRQTVANDGSHAHG